MLLAFYWAEMLHKVEGKTGLSAKVMTSLTKMKIPFIIVAFLVLAVEFSTNLIRYKNFQFFTNLKF